MASGVRESSEPPSPGSAFDESCTHACAGDSRHRAAGVLGAQCANPAKCISWLPAQVSRNMGFCSHLGMDLGYCQAVLGQEVISLFL